MSIECATNIATLEQRSVGSTRGADERFLDGDLSPAGPADCNIVTGTLQQAVFSSGWYLSYGQQEFGARAKWPAICL